MKIVALNKVGGWQPIGLSKDLSGILVLWPFNPDEN